MTEQQLVQGCIREDRRCQKELFARYAGKMTTVCRRYARRSVEAEDILQDAFIRIFDHIRQFEFKGSLEGWIRRIVVNTALKNYSKLSFQNENTGLAEIEEGFDNPDVFSALHEEYLLHLISRLPDGYRLVFNLAAIEGYSHKEIAETLGIEESTSRSQLTKARRFLQLKIADAEKITI